MLQFEHTHNRCFTVCRLHKSGEVVASDRIRIERDAQTHTLVISDVTTSDRGYYTCFVTNEHGSDKCSAEIVVEGVESKT